MSEKSSFALIVPCYNEVHAIPLFESELTAFYRDFTNSFPDFEFAIVFVDNNSVDGSLERLYALAEKHVYVKVQRCTSQGYGAALKHGFKSVRADYLGFLDLDNTYPMKAFLPMLTQLQALNGDIVFGARLHTNSHISPVRKSGNLLYVLLLRWLIKSPLSDVCSGMRIFRGNLKDQVTALKSDDLSFSIEFTANVIIEKWNISEFPIEYRDRIGESKLSVFKDGFEFLWVVLRKYFGWKK